MACRFYTLFLSGRAVSCRVQALTSLAGRMRGLLGRDSLPAGEAVWLNPCRSIHTIGMKFDLDLIFLGRGHDVVRIVRGVPPQRLVLGGPKARSVLEMQAGWFPATDLRPGDRAELKREAAGGAGQEK